MMMNATERIEAFLRRRERFLLPALLIVLHIVLLGESGSPIARMGWLADFGLFLLWQPFVQAGHRLDARSLLLLMALLGLGGWFFGDWLLIFWTMLLAALLGGRIMMFGHRPTRIYYLLAFAYLLAALFGWLAPRVLPHAADSGLPAPLLWGLATIFPVMALLPRLPESRLPRSGMTDVLSSLFVLLMIAVLFLGSFAFMLLWQTDYIGAVAGTLIGMAVFLLFIAWAWHPRSDLSGIGVFFSRHILTLALPFDIWLQRLMEAAEREDDPDRFASEVCAGLLDVPWIVGSAWRPAAESSAEVSASMAFGAVSPHRYDFSRKSLAMTLYSAHAMTPSLAWHFSLLAKVTDDYYNAKLRARELERMSYLRAIHETGARLTHDIKNLLQALNNLCFAAQNAATADPSRVNALLQRQLPQIAQRLQHTLEKLRAPMPVDAQDQVPSDRTTPGAWWEALQQRHTHDGVDFITLTCDAERRAGESASAPAAPIAETIPEALFDNVAENLLQNALIKRRRVDTLAIRVSFSVVTGCLRVCDTGPAVPAPLLRNLLHAPVVSENGLDDGLDTEPSNRLGIGLYSAARLAERHGYELRLAENTPGRVCFELRRKDRETTSRRSQD